MNDSEVKDMSRYVAKLRLDGNEGLGVVVPWHILTCAHYAPAVRIDPMNVLLRTELDKRRTSASMSRRKVGNDGRASA